MRWVLSAAICLLVLAGCAFPPGSGSKPQSQAAAAPGDAPAPKIDACKLMTAEDVQAALGVPIDKSPVSSPPDAGGSVVGSCIYAAPAQNATAGLIVFSNLPVDVIGVTAGYHPVAGVGDRAYVNSTMLVAQKGSTTFQIVIAISGSQANVEQMLRALGRAVAGRL